MSGAIYLAKAGMNYCMQSQVITTRQSPDEVGENYLGNCCRSRMVISNSIAIIFNSYRGSPSAAFGRNGGMVLQWEAPSTAQGLQAVLQQQSLQAVSQTSQQNLQQALQPQRSLQPFS